MNAEQKTPIIAFDPGGTTGFAALSGNGEVLFTVALMLEEIESFIEFLTLLRPRGTKELGKGIEEYQLEEEGSIAYYAHNLEYDIERTNEIDVVVEKGPTRSNSAVTRRVEEKLLTAFPKAHLITPSQWKSHPAARLSHLRFSTKHEYDAAGLGRWFYETRSNHGRQGNRANDAARTHSERSGR